MKKLFFIAFVALFFASCGSSTSPASTIEDSTVNERDTSTERKPIPVDQELTAKSIYFGKIEKNEWTVSEDESEIGPYKTQTAGLNIAVALGDSDKLQTLRIFVTDQWKLGKDASNNKDQGRTERLQNFYNEMRQLKNQDFVIVVNNGMIKSIYAKPRFKESKDGHVGELVAPQKEVWPYPEQSE